MKKAILFSTLFILCTLVSCTTSVEPQGQSMTSTSKGLQTAGTTSEVKTTTEAPTTTLPYVFITEQKITSVEVGEDVDYNAILSCNNGKAKLKSGSINNKVVGEYSLVYELTYENNLEEKVIVVVVEDKQAPIIKQLVSSFEYGEEIDLLSSNIIAISDNVDTNPVLEVVEGSIDNKMPGKYNVSYKGVDCYGNATEVVYEFTVNRKIYTIAELTEYAQNRANEIKKKGVELDVKVDEFGTGITISSASDLFKGEKDMYVAVISAMMLDSDTTEDQVVSYSFMTLVYHDEIFSKASKIYIKNDKEQIESHQVVADWDYTNSYFVGKIIYLEDHTNYSKEHVETLCNIFAGDNVKMRITGSFDINVNIPDDLCEAAHEMLKLYMELTDMYYGDK